MYSYKAFSLTIYSQLVLPQLVEIIGPIVGQSHDIIIRYDNLSSEKSDELTTIGLYCHAKFNYLNLHVPHVAQFLVINGNEIIIDPVNGIDEYSLGAFTLGPCMVALLMQRDLFLLHGNAVQIGDRCVSFSGGHGTGKSTLSAVFSNKGYPVLTDDICAINSQGEVLPSFPQIDIWQDVASQLMVNTRLLRKIRPCIAKFALPLGNQFCSDSLPLHTIYIITPYNQNSFSLMPLAGCDKIKYLHRLIYNKPFVSGLKKDPVCFNYCAMLAERVDMFILNRPKLGLQLNKLVQFIEKTWDVEYATE